MEYKGTVIFCPNQSILGSISCYGWLGYMHSAKYTRAFRTKSKWHHTLQCWWALTDTGFIAHYCSLETVSLVKYNALNPVLNILKYWLLKTKDIVKISIITHFLSCVFSVHCFVVVLVLKWEFESSLLYEGFSCWD